MNTPEQDDPTVVDAEVVDTPDPGRAVQPALPVIPTPPLEPDYTDAGVPTFDYVRDRIESRSATATGSTDLAGLGGTGPSVKSLDEQLAEREEAGRARLAEIRKAMGKSD
ncbi:PspA/IM30 family protein [Actinokineospora globicatena]|uniref:PspA/IM30 family protein n=1 Tax=Actinokineospora globicatena TaxID=103729 RepID=UPI0020A5A847|nr:hypothetical protein [Actinokineospora globicatena]MCP2306021.1 hypothetical protein [Actinokineospora globicatena]GLW80107.1 hypothetical protein Aglo01_45880 [Actinokineospora globicatena]GLW86936.1 hypothetical protein Aglo02_45750 [Actinokineospora globicatena]